MSSVNLFAFYSSFFNEENELQMISTKSVLKSWLYYILWCYFCFHFDITWLFIWERNHRDNKIEEIEKFAKSFVYVYFGVAFALSEYSRKALKLALKQVVFNLVFVCAFKLYDTSAKIIKPHC